MDLKFTGTKRLIGQSKDRTATADRFLILDDDKKESGAWLIRENGRPIGVEPSWDKAQERLRKRGYRVRAETVAKAPGTKIQPKE